MASTAIPGVLDGLDHALECRDGRSILVACKTGQGLRAIWWRKADDASETVLAVYGHRIPRFPYERLDSAGKDLDVIRGVERVQSPRGVHTRPVCRRVSMDLSMSGCWSREDRSSWGTYGRHSEEVDVLEMGGEQEGRHVVVPL